MKDRFFMTSGARGYVVQGTSGQTYTFNSVKPTKVRDQDVPGLRRIKAIQETDSEGQTLGSNPTPRPKPITYFKFQPPAKKTTARQPQSERGATR